MDDLYARYRESLRLGHQQASEGRFADALVHYRAAAEVAGGRALPHVAIGAMLLRLARQREALDAYDRALALEPDNLDALSGRAAALLATGRRGDAEEVRKQIASIRAGGGQSGTVVTTPGESSPLSGAEAHAVAAEQARLAGNVGAAIDALLAESDEHVHDEHFDAALDACLRALALDSGATRIHLEMVRVYFVRGWIDQAVDRVATLRRLLELAPDPIISQSLDDLERIYARAQP